MGRPREFDRTEALTAAMHLFWERGYERTSIKDLTDAMGISAPSLYNTFGDKQALFEEAVAEYERSPAVVLPQSIGKPTAREVFASMLDVAVREYPSNQHPHGCLVISDPVLGENRTKGRDAIRARLQRARDEGDVPSATDLDGLTDYIDLVLRGLSALARDGANAQALRAAADVALRAWPA
jgi:AcrR family transcriptional regulator